MPVPVPMAAAHPPRLPRRPRRRRGHILGRERHLGDDDRAAGAVQPALLVEQRDGGHALAAAVRGVRAARLEAVVRGAEEVVGRVGRVWCVGVAVGVRVRVCVAVGGLEH